MTLAATAPRKPYAEAAHELLRNSLLDAALELLDESNWGDISMAEIATRAGVSRQTLYNEFGSRDEFAQHFALREADRFLVLVEQEIVAHPDDPQAALTQAFTTFLTAANTNSMVRAIVVRESGADELFALFTTQGGPVVQLATERLRQTIVSVWQVRDEHAVKIAAETLVRLGISHAGLPTGSVRDAADAVARVIWPFLANTLAAEGLLNAE